MPTDEMQTQPLSAPWEVIDSAKLRRLRDYERMLAALMEDFDGAIAAHDPTDSRHPSHGGQHTNGRCCAFGSVNPAAINVMRRWLREYVEIS